MTLRMQALRPHVMHYDGPNGRWTGAILRSVDRDADGAVIEAREGGVVFAFSGPASSLPGGDVGAPVAVRVTRESPLRVLEIVASHFADSVDAQRAAAGEPGIFGVVPRSITLASNEFEWTAE